MPAGAGADGGDDEEVIIEEVESGAADKGAVGANAGGDEPGEDDDGRPEAADADSADAEIDKIEKEKKGMTAVEKLERSTLWKAEGNGFFKKDEIFKATDAYYHAILYCRDLVQNPQYYPNLGHTEEQRQMAKDIVESTFSNLALAQSKHGSALPLTDPERPKVLREAVKSASEALKLNENNIKALYRRGCARSSLAKGEAKNDEGQKLCMEAKADFMAVLEKDPKNRDARVELKDVQDRLKSLKREEVASEKREFSFASTLSALGSKVKDLLGDGTVRKVQTAAGDGGSWLNEDWLQWDSRTKCVVHMRCSMLSTGGDDGRATKATGKTVTISFILGDLDMHEGFSAAIKSMTVGEVAECMFAPERLKAEGSLAKTLPNHHGQRSVWEVAFIKFVTWEDLDRNGERLQKIQNEGYGATFAEPLSEVHMHWRVFGPEGNLLHSTRYTVNIAGEGGLKHTEDEDKQAPVYVVGEGTWEPLAVLCKSLRQGGVGELRMRQLPELPQDTGQDATSAQLSMVLNKAKGPEALRHCVVQAELERVIQPIAGPEDPRWESTSALIQERFRAEQLLEKGEEHAALVRLRRAASWAEQLLATDAAASGELATARASIGWVLASRAAPILDLGDVSSAVLKVARRDLAEAEEHCSWLEESAPDLVGTRLLRAKILVAQDDDVAGAHRQLLEAQRRAPDDKRVQAELRRVKVELRKAEEEESRAKVVEIREGLKRARTEGHAADREAAVLALLRQLSTTKVTWDTVMETRIGVELKSCQTGCGDEATRLCGEILGRFKDESKEQRPMWES